MDNQVEILDISPRGIQVIETQYSIDGTSTCIHTSCGSDRIKLLTINWNGFGLHPKDRYPISENKLTFDLNGAKQLRDMLASAIDGLEQQEYRKKSRPRLTRS